MNCLKISFFLLAVASSIYSAPVERSYSDSYSSSGSYGSDSYGSDSYGSDSYSSSSSYESSESYGGY